MAKKELKDKKQKSNYFKEMKAELKKVVWPTPKELVNHTVTVILFVVIIAVIVFVLDFCFENLNKYGVGALQEKVQSSMQTTEGSEDNESQENEESGEGSENNETQEIEGLENETINDEGLEDINVQSSEEQDNENINAESNE